MYEILTLVKVKAGTKVTKFRSDLTMTDDLTAPEEPGTYNLLEVVDELFNHKGWRWVYAG